MTQISLEFRRALEAEIKRLFEQRPVFGQGGKHGAAIRSLDREVQQIDDQVGRLDAVLPALVSKYSRLFSEMTALGPSGRKDADRLMRIMRALGKAETSLGEFGQYIRDARNAH